MKWIDLHVHAKLSKSLPFDERFLAQNSGHARRLGLDGIGLVEHMHGVDFWPMYEQLIANHDYRDGILWTEDGFPILTGAEISIRGGADLLLYAPIERLRAFDRALQAPATSGYKASLHEALTQAHSHDIFVIGAHPFRSKKDLAKFDVELLERVDAFELNGKDFNRDSRVRDLASRLNRPLVAGSDAHFWPQVGIKQTGVEVDSISLSSVSREIAGNRGEVRVLAYGPIATRICKLYKKIAKSRSLRREMDKIVSIASI